MVPASDIVQMGNDFGLRLTCPGGKRKLSSLSFLGRDKITVKNENVEVILMKSLVWSIQPHEFASFAMPKSSPKMCIV
uniref:Uncharacterized protein n=1 Tax=Solanum tuberosum TaxID=4113 RepID=M1DGM7_SOLTU